jgi:simple sugar transport system substrate-binding protein
MKARSKYLGTAAILACLMSAAHADPFKIGFVLPNAIGEVGWDHELDRGRQAIVDHFGNKVEMNAVSGVGEGPDSTRVMTKMVADGAQMLILGSFGHMKDGLALAKSHPQLSVLHLTGYMNEKNFATIDVRHYEATYLCGMAAGMATKSDNLGIVAAFPLPLVVNMMNAYVLGAQSVNSHLKPVKVVWLNSWYNPAMEKSAAESLVSQGADVVFSLFPGTPSTVATAQQLGVYVVATDTDSTKFAPTKHLCAAQMELGPGFIEKTQQAIDGHFLGDDTFAGIKEGGIHVAGLNKDLSESQKQMILAKQDEIRTGKFKPFTGPITSNDGKEVVPAGTSLDDKSIKNMNFLVKGIDTTLPK